jgi:hypothetical protein
MPNSRLRDRGLGLQADTGTQAVAKQLVPGMRRLLYVAAVLVLLAGLQLFVFTDRTAAYFAWTIRNPLAATFLGAAYWASAAFEWIAARQRIWANARVAVPAVLVFTVLTLAATLTHLGSFHLGDQFTFSANAVTWAWIAIYSLVPMIMMIIIALQIRAPGSDPPRSATLPNGIRGLLVWQAVVLLSLGTALYVVPTHAVSWWPWKLTPLLGQAIGAWLISLGIAAGHALLERDPRRLRPASVAYILLAVLLFIALARYPGSFRWSSAAGVIYLTFVATMLVTGLAGLAGWSPQAVTARSRP